MIIKELIAALVVCWAVCIGIAIALVVTDLTIGGITGYKIIPHIQEALK